MLSCHRLLCGVLFTAALLSPLAKLTADVPHSPDPACQVAPQVPIRAYAFDLEDVQLLDGPFLHARELDRKYLLSFDTDRLLHTFRLNAGLPSTAQPLGGWEEPKSEVRGHFVGHYLSACAILYAGTKDVRLKEKAEQVVAGLAECQAKLGSGYLSAYPEEFIDRVEARQRVWAPYYTLHKIYAGLLDVHRYGGSAQALDVCQRFADWVIARNGRLSDEQMQAMLDNEHGGMNEVLANLYAVTGEEKYLKIAERFNHMAVIGPASRREDKLTGLHANTQIPKFVGTARQHELTGAEWLHTASDFFWDTVVNERSYVIGGHSDGEVFTPKEKLSEAFGPNTTETCNTYNMLKLTRHLFCWTADARYADYYERALINHILASQNPETGMMCYYVPLRSGSRKVYNEPLDSFWCCTGTGIENHAKYSDSIYFHDGKGRLYVNLFIASELRWREKGLKVRQETGYPDEARTQLKLLVEKPVELQVGIRRPAWASQGFQIRVNGEAVAADAEPGSFAVVQRTWNDGDTLTVEMPFALRTEGFRDNPQRFAVLYGPQVLCAEIESGPPFPAVVSDVATLLESLKPVRGKPSTFRAAGELFRRLGGEKMSEPVFEPFHKMHENRRYIVYWDQYTPDQWQQREAEYQAELQRQRELAARTTDWIEVGDPDSERAHGQQGVNTGAGPYSNRHWRHAWDGGWFSYELKVQPGKEQQLVVTYWGSDSGNRNFDVIVEGVKIATQRLQNNRPGEFYDETYVIPAEVTRDKTAVTVKFQAHPGAIAGGIFGCRILK